MVSPGPSRSHRKNAERNSKVRASVYACTCAHTGTRESGQRETVPTGMVQWRGWQTREEAARAEEGKGMKVREGKIN